MGEPPLMYHPIIIKKNSGKFIFSVHAAADIALMQDRIECNTRAIFFGNILFNEKLRRFTIITTLNNIVKP